MESNKKITLINMFVDRENILHAQYSIGGQFFQEQVPLESSYNEF